MILNKKGKIFFILVIIILLGIAGLGVKTITSNRVKAPNNVVKAPDSKNKTIIDNKNKTVINNAKHGTIVDLNAGVSPNPFSFQSARSICTDPESGTTWVFYLKRTPNTNVYQIVYRTNIGDKQGAIPDPPAPDFTISCRPPYIWLAYADADAIKILLRKGTFNNNSIRWESPVVVADNKISFGAQTPVVAWLADGRPIITYWGNDKEGFFRTYISVARDTQGTKWGQSTTLIRGGHVNVSKQISSTVFRVGSGAIALTWQPSDKGSVPLGTYINTYLGGDSWSSPQQVPFKDFIVASQTSVVTDSSGTAHLLYATTGKKDKKAKYVSVNSSGVWSTPIVVGETGPYETCLAINDKDELYAVFDRIFLARRSLEGVFEVPIPIFSLSKTTSLTFTQCSEKSNSGGNIPIAWSEGLDDWMIMSGNISIQYEK